MFRLSTITVIILLSMASMLFTACSSSSKVDTNTTIDFVSFFLLSTEQEEL